MSLVELREEGDEWEIHRDRLQIHTFNSLGRGELNPQPRRESKLSLIPGEFGQVYRGFLIKEQPSVTTTVEGSAPATLVATEAVHPVLHVIDSDVHAISGGEFQRVLLARAILREPDFLVLTEAAQEAPREEKAKLALTIMAAVLIPVIMDWVPIYIAVVIGAAFMVLTRCLTMEEAYRYIEWKAVFLIAGMLPLGTALDNTGAARLLAEGVVGTLGPFGPYAVLFGLLAITFIATSIIPTAALVVLMVPIALKTATSLGISPYALMMGIAMAASSSFTSPISHPANVLVMGPGGYRFIDYIKVGVPLTLVILIVLMIVLPIFWPL